MPKILDHIELWEPDRSAQIALPDGNGVEQYLTSQARVTRRLGGVDELSLTIKSGSDLAIATSGDAYELSQGKIIRLVYDDSSIEEWRIKTGSREFSGERDVQITAEPIEQDLKTYTVRKTLANGHTRASVSFYNQTFQEIVSSLITTEYNCPDLFTLGAVESGLNDTNYNVVFNASYIIEALKKLCQMAEAEWDVSYNSTNDNYEINFYQANNMGGGEAQAPDRPIVMGGGEGNRLSLEKRDETEEYFSRVVPLMGEGSEIQTVADARWRVDTATYNNPDSTVTLKENAIIKDGYGLIDGQTIYFGNSSEGWYEVTATSKPNGLTLSGDASALTHGYLKEGANKNDVIFLEDADALQNVGLKEEKFQRPDIPPYSNLIEDAGISATLSDWSGGLPVGYNLINGAETVSEATADLFVKHGTKSAKVSCNQGQGLQTDDVTLEPEDLSPYFSTTVYLQVETGSVRVEVIDGSGQKHPKDKLAETNVNETRAIKIGGMEPASGAAQIKIIAQSDNTVFYLDAITLTQSASAIEYAPLMGPKALWVEAGKHLKKYGGDRPDVWQGEVMDDAFFDSSAKEIEVGSFVKVQEDWNENTSSYDTEFTVRVVEVSYREDRINGRYKKTVRLADKHTEAARVFQEQYLTVGSQQSSLQVREVPEKPIIDIDNAVVEGGTPRFEQVEIYPSTAKPPMVLGDNAKGELVTGLNANLIEGMRLTNGSANLDLNSINISGKEFVDSNRNITANNLEVEGTINYVNEENLQVEDKTITVNKNGTNSTAEGAGIIVERPDSNRNFLWNSTLGFHFDDDIATSNFGLGANEFAGTGARITHGGEANVERLIVRKYAKFRELIIDQLGVVAGSTILSGARGKVKSRTGNDVTIEDPRNTGVTAFEVGSLFVVRNVDVDNSEFKFVAGIVTAKNGTTITLSNADADLPAEDQGKAWGDITTIAEGDVIAERGHVSNTARQNVIYETATDSDAPVTKYLDNIDSLTAFSQAVNIQTQLGILDSLTGTYSAVAGKGLFSSRTYLTDILQVGNLDASGEDFFKFQNGTLTWEATNTTLDSSGNLTATNATLAGTLQGVDGYFSGEVGVGQNTTVTINPTSGEPADPTVISGSTDTSTADIIIPDADEGIVYYSNEYTIPNSNQTVEVEFNWNREGTELTGYHNPVARLEFWNGSSWVTEDKWDGGKLSTPLANHTPLTILLGANAKSYSKARVACIDSDNSDGPYGNDDTRFSNITFRQYQSVVVLTDSTLWIKNSPNDIVALGGGYNTLKNPESVSAGESSVSSVFGRTGDITAQQSDYDSFFVPKSGGTFDGQVNADRLDSIYNDRHLFLFTSDTDMRIDAYDYGTSSYIDFQLGDTSNSNKVIFGNTPYVAGNNVWHAGNFDPSSKANSFSNRSNLTSINQDLGTSNSPSFSGITATGKMLISYNDEPVKIELNNTATGGANFSIDGFKSGDVTLQPTGGSGSRLVYTESNDDWTFETSLKIEGNVIIDNGSFFRGKTSGGSNASLIGRDGDDRTLVDAISGGKIVFRDGSSENVLIDDSGHLIVNTQIYSYGAIQVVTEPTGNLYAQYEFEVQETRNALIQWDERPTNNQYSFFAGSGGSISVVASLDENGTFVSNAVEANTIETDVLRTTLFKPEIVSGIAGETVFNAVSQVTAIDTGNNNITFEDAVFNNGDYIAVSSGNYNSKGFSNTRIQITSSGSSVSDGTQYSYSVVSGAGGEADISVGDTGVKANGNMIYVDARDGTTNGPKLAGYQGLSNFSDSPIGGGSASPNWELTPEHILYDGLQYTIYSPTRVAGYGTGPQAIDPESDYWTTSASNGSSGGTNDSWMYIIRDKFLLRKGTNYVQVTFYGRQNSFSSGATNYTGTGRVRITVAGQSQTIDFSNGTYGSYKTVTINVENISNGYQPISVEGGALISSDGAATCEVYVRSDLLVTGQATI